MGRLYVVSTPIGNLEDVTHRAVRTLGEVDRVLAEDTRRTRILLQRYGISTPVVSAHTGNEERRAEEVVAWLEQGEDLALVTDAGTPLVSDPGARIVRRALEMGYEVVPVPGPSAVLAGLVGSGLDAGRFTFLGFLPRSGGERTRFLEEAAVAGHTVVLFEAPGRLARLLRDLEDACGSARQAVVARELTKVHEEFRRGTLAELASYYEEAPPRGEAVVLVAAAGEEEREGAVRPDEEAARALARALLADGRSPSRVARDLARRLGLPRNRAYALALAEAAAGEEGAP